MVDRHELGDRVGDVGRACLADPPEATGPKFWPDLPFTVQKFDNHD